MDAQELNRKFYRELIGWFEWTKQTAKFPTGASDHPVKQQDQIIRLITRLLFVWFIKEKGLVDEDLFHKPQMENLLKDGCRPDGEDYYRAVLQNLFFATLNTEIGKRGFSERNTTTRRSATHRNFNLYRYKDLLNDRDSLLKRLAQTPFINGGLFDCLDTEEAIGDQGYRVDCFTDSANHRKQLSIPNRLFFDAEHGLFPLLQRYKFTVEERTPIEQEVALDPELLGNVFENLLAEYNPETQENARKNSGSYYTPHEIVDYMVNEACIARLAETAQPSDGDGDFWRERLRYLLDYADSFDDAKELFQEEEKERVVTAISQIKVLDPAVGSGAFPMGILHKLTLGLKRIDPDNQLWEKLQKERAARRAETAFDTSNQQEREEELIEISQIFERDRDSDFGRKLYLIRNSIYGVDIQPIACQIAKLRFFISLTIEQTADKQADNFGIKPLPNLETRFVATDTLLGLGKRGQMPLSNDAVRKLEARLQANGERHYNAKTRGTKLRSVREDKELRNKLAEELKAIGFGNANADRIAQWDRYDQNGVADWFDPEYMFFVRDGFDLVIGNPPYIQLQKNGGRLADRYQDAGFQTFARTGDIYQLFYEKGAESLVDGGLICYITSNSWLRANYGKALRQYFYKQHSPLKLLEIGKDIFENTIVDTNILLLRKGRGSELCQAVDMDRLEQKDFPPDANLWVQMRPQSEKPWSILSPAEQKIKDKIEAVGTPLKDWDVNIYRGIVTGYNEAFIINTETRDRLIGEDPRSDEVIKPILRGRDIHRYSAQWAGLWLIYSRKGIQIENYPSVYNHLSKYKEALSKKAGGNQWYELQASPSDYFNSLFSKEKIFWMEMTNRGRFSYTREETYCNNKVYIIAGKPMKYLCAVLNANLISWFMKTIALTTGMGLVEWFKIYVEMIPTPKTPEAQQKPFIQLVDKILAQKSKDPKANTTDLEAEIDQLVYRLYGLTEEEILIVENSK